MEKKRIHRVKEIKSALLGLFLLLFLTGCNKADGELTLEQVLEQGDTAAEGRGMAAEMKNTAAETEDTGRQTESIWVHICGEVAAPGIYELEAGSRIYDVLMAAGGFTGDADTDFYNLAGVVTDGMQIRIPGVQETAETLPGADADTGGRVNINTATAEQLQTLPGIGESRARDIITYREKHGGFDCPEQIMEVSGIKNAVYEKIRDLITTGA